MENEWQAAVSRLAAAYDDDADVDADGGWAARRDANESQDETR